MTKTQLLSTALIAGSLFGASQAVMAYEAGDILIRGDVAKTSPEGDDDNAISNEKGFIGSVGIMVHDKMAVTLGGGEEFEHTYKAGEPGDSFERQPFDLSFPFGKSFHLTLGLRIDHSSLVLYTSTQSPTGALTPGKNF